MKMKKLLKNTAIAKTGIAVSLVLLISAVAYLGYAKMEKNRIQAETSLAEMQGKLESQKGVIETQQTKIDELQGFKVEQQQANDQLSEQDRQRKQDDCAARLKKAQDNLASAQRYLGEDQKVLKVAEAGTCEDCYKPCMKSYGDITDSEMLKKTKDQCKENDEENLKNRKADVSGDLENVKKSEVELQKIKNECGQ